MKIGIYGGSFNPIHLGHEMIAKLVLENLNLDKLIIIPVGIPSHRENNLKNSLLRYELCKIVFKDIKKIEVSDIEIKQNKVSYTYDTLLEIRKIYGKNNEYYEIIGEDSLENFETWKNYKEILELCKLVVLKRKSYKEEKIKEIKNKIKHKNIIFLENDYFNFSSTEIREKLSRGEDISSMVNPLILPILLNNN